MINKQIITKFKEAFSTNKIQSPRGIGIECEIPVVTEKGAVVPIDIIQNMFVYLAENGFKIEWDDYSGLMLAAKRMNIKSAERFDCHTDTITTDVGYSTLEIVLAPQDNLHALQSHFEKLLFLLMPYFEGQNCRMLGYGIQPLTPPSAKVMIPKERYRFFEKLSTSRIIPPSEGGDASFLTITASNQCHLEISLEDAIPATNVLNALSGLQIALQANSPIWKGKVDATHKATREILWESSFPNRRKQMGIPPKFDNIESYVNYLFQFKPLLVKRDKRYFKILNKRTFENFLLNESPTIGEALNGQKRLIKPRQEDIDTLLPFCYFNARLVPKHGTVESRMCCQQPPTETLTSAALTLGIIENLEAAEDLARKFPLKTWREIRKKASQYTFNAHINELSILPSIQDLLDLANEGLKKRNLQEEVFLQPLYQRLEHRKSPADVAIEVFNTGGMKALLEHVSFNEEAYNEVQALDQATLVI